MLFRSGKVMPIPPALLNVANDLYVKWMNVTANCNNGRDESACGEAIMGASSAVNEFDGLIEKMLDSQPTHIQKWLENEANKL